MRGRPVHRLALHPCSERWQERWISRTSRSSSVPGVGKTDHWATALSRDGRKVLDRALPNDEERLRALYKKLADHGSLLVVVDQPATIGALAVAVAQDMGITVGYLPGLSMRRIADLTPGSAKTDAKDAAVIAQAARTMPHTLRAVSASDEEAAALSMLTDFDLDLHHGRENPWCHAATLPPTPPVQDALALRASSQARYGQDAAQTEAALLARIGQHGEMTGDDVAQIATDDATGELGGEATNEGSGPANGVPGATADVVFGRRPDRRSGGTG